MIFNIEEVVHMIQFLKLIQFTVLLYFADPNWSEMVNKIKSKTL